MPTNWIESCTCVIFSGATCPLLLDINLFYNKNCYYFTSINVQEFTECKSIHIGLFEMTAQKNGNSNNNSFFCFKLFNPSKKIGKKNIVCHLLCLKFLFAVCVCKIIILCFFLVKKQKQNIAFLRKKNSL